MMRLKKDSRGMIFRQTSRFRGHFTKSKDNFSVGVSNDVGLVCVELVFPAHRWSRTIAVFVLLSLSHPILRVLRWRLIRKLLFDVCVLRSKMRMIHRWVWRTLNLLQLTSNTPKHRPNRPTTPASSNSSLTAVSALVSSCSTPPPGTIHRSGYLLDDTSRTWM